MFAWVLDFLTDALTKMTTPNKLNLAVSSAFVLICVATTGFAQESGPEAKNPVSESALQIRLKLKDGTSFSVDEAAELIGISKRTVNRQWRKARLILMDAIREGA